ncbi:hypothetical protein IWW55_006214, partial [Coemansia sp. RSA 2706]
QPRARQGLPAHSGQDQGDSRAAQGAGAVRKRVPAPAGAAAGAARGGRGARGDGQRRRRPQPQAAGGRAAGAGVRRVRDGGRPAARVPGVRRVCVLARARAARRAGGAHCAAPGGDGARVCAGLCARAAVLRRVRRLRVRRRGAGGAGGGADPVARGAVRLGGAGGQAAADRVGGGGSVAGAGAVPARARRGDGVHGRARAAQPGRDVLPQRGAAGAGAQPGGARVDAQRRAPPAPLPRGARADAGQRQRRRRRGGAERRARGAGGVHGVRAGGGVPGGVWRRARAVRAGGAAARAVGAARRPCRLRPAGRARVPGRRAGRAARGLHRERRAPGAALAHGAVPVPGAPGLRRRAAEHRDVRALRQRHARARPDPGHLAGHPRRRRPRRAEPDRVDAVLAAPAPLARGARRRRRAGRVAGRAPRRRLRNRAVAGRAPRGDAAGLPGALHARRAPGARRLHVQPLPRHRRRRHQAAVHQGAAAGADLPAQALRRRRQARRLCAPAADRRHDALHRVGPGRARAGAG